MNHGNLPNPVPLEISYADSATISVSPGVPAGTLNQINIYDNARMVVYIWVKNSTYPTGSWQNVNIAGTGGAYSSPAAGQTPIVTPGANNLTLVWYFTNTGNVSATFTASTTITWPPGTLTNPSPPGNIYTNNIVVTPGAQNQQTVSTYTMPNAIVTIGISVTP
jgi:hypothetical protein